MTNIQDPAIQQPKHSDSTLDTQDSAMQRPAKATLNQPQLQPPKQPQAKNNFGKRFCRGYSSFCRRLGLALLVALFFRFLFELVPEMKAEMAKPYQVFTFGTKVLKWVYDFVFGFIGSLFRGELGSFFPQVWEGAKELFQNFIALF